MRFNNFLNERKVAPVSLEQAEKTIRNYFKDLKNDFLRDVISQISANTPYLKRDILNNKKLLKEFEEEIFIEIQKDESSKVLVIKIVEKYLTKKLNFDDSYGPIRKDLEYFWQKYKEKLSKFVNSFGYYISKINTNWARKIVFTCQPNYGNIVNVPNKIYHFSSIYNKEKILKKGIIPKASNRLLYLYKEKSFFLTKFNLADVAALHIAISSYNSSPEDMYYGNVDVPDIVVFEIDTTKLKGIKFFEDYDAVNSVWTYSHIKPQYLKIVYEDKEDE